MREKDNKSGFMMNASLFCALVLMSLASAHLFAQKTGTIVNYCMVPIALVSMYLTYTRSDKIGTISALSLSAVLFALTLVVWRDQAITFLFWLFWMPTMIFCISRLRVGINGLFAERDFYRSECARVAMIDPITQMRNLHAFLNDAPIYIRIAKRYKLSMVVLAVKLVNVEKLRNELTEVAFHEMLDGVSHAMRSSVRLEDLAYFIDSNTGVWCINMFTHLDAIDIVLKRIKKALAPIAPDFEEGQGDAMSFAYGYSTYDPENECTPMNLLQRAIDMTEQNPM